MIVTLVPAAGVAALLRCTQKVAPTHGMYSCTIVCPDPTVRDAEPSQSLPTPNTHELALVVVSVAVGAPVAALADRVAPIAPEPFVPDVSTPVKVTTTIDETVGCAIVAVTPTLVSAAGANARQISVDPRWAFVRATSTHVSPAPVTPVDAFPGVVSSIATKASNSWFPLVVEKALVVTVVVFSD